MNPVRGITLVVGLEKDVVSAVCSIRFSYPINTEDQPKDMIKALNEEDISAINIVMAKLNDAAVKFFDEHPAGQVLIH